MIDITLKIRFFSFIFIVLFLFPLCFFLGFNVFNIIEGINNPSRSFVFSSWSLSIGIIAPFFFFTFLIASVKPIFLGERVSDKMQLLCGRGLIFIVFIGVILKVGIGLYFDSEFKRKGYVTCPGIPSGWMPGMATKYAKTEALCSSGK